MIKVKDGYAKLIGTTYSGSVSRVLLSNGGDHILGNSNGNIPLNNGTINTNLNADMLDGLHIHAGRNNEANKIVRTDASGYIQAGWINTTSGDMGTSAINRIYCSNDGYIRYKTPANFFSTLANDSNQLSITVGSQNRKLTVAYATNSDTVDGLHASDFKRTWNGYAGKTYIGWIKIIEWTITKANHFSPLSFILQVYRNYNSPSPESYTLAFNFGQDSANIVQLNSNSGSRIIENFRVTKTADGLKYFVEMYVNTSYTTFQNTCYFAIGNYRSFNGSLVCDIQSETVTELCKITTSSNNIVAPGYVKKGSSDSYVLLGGGSHKALSDFSMAHNHPYLPLAGGTMNQGSHVIFPGTSTDTNYGGSIEFREVNYVTTSQTDWSYAPGITFHWGGRSVGKLGLKSDGNLAWRNQTIIHSGNISSQSVNYANNAGNADTVDGLHATNLVRFYLSPMTNNAPADSAKSWFINTMPSGSGAIVYNVPGIEKTIIAGKSTGAYGHLLQLNYVDTYLRILRYYNGSWKSTDWEKISAGYADSAGNADTLDGNHASAFALVGHTHNYDNVYSKLGHTHDDRYYTESEINSKLSAYLPLAGGTMTGVIKSTYASSTYINGVTNAILKGEYTDYGAILSMPVKDGRVSLSSYPASNNNIYFGYATTSQINAGTNSFNKQMYWDAANNNLHAGVFTGYLSGNASTATKWATARTLTIGNTGKTVDGSGNVSWSLAEIGAATSGHTHTLSLASDTGTSSITLAHGGKYKLTAGGNSVIFTLPTDNNTNPANYYWANIKVSATSNVGTAPQFGKVKINTTSSTYQLNVSGDSYVTNWCRAGKGLYLENSGIYFAYSDKSATTAEIDLLSNNEFCWGANSDTLYFNFKKASRNATTVTKYVWNAGSSSTYATHTTGDIILGNKNYQIKRAGYGSNYYYNGRNTAMIRTTSAVSYSTIMSMKTYNGSWEIGNGIYVADALYFLYVSDSAFNSANPSYVPPYIYFDSSASVYATHFYEHSDIRYKKILRNLSINSDTIATLPLFDFEWIENNVIGTGTSAQAVQQILPNLVSGTDKLTLDYGVLGTIAGITACKELVTQKSELQQLKEKVKELEDKLRKYENI